jgi:Mg2+ and Co2+ transporter CorA
LTACDREEDRTIFYELRLALSREQLITFRRSPERDQLFSLDRARAACHDGETVGELFFHLVDSVADELTAANELHEEIDEVEEAVDRGENPRKRLADL